MPLRLARWRMSVRTRANERRSVSMHVSSRFFRSSWRTLSQAFREVTCICNRNARREIYQRPSNVSLITANRDDASRHTVRPHDFFSPHTRARISMSITNLQSTILIASLIFTDPSRRLLQLDRSIARCDENENENETTTSRRAERTTTAATTTIAVLSLYSRRSSLTGSRRRGLHVTNKTENRPRQLHRALGEEDARDAT